MGFEYVWRRFSLAACGMYSPFVEATTQDHHILRELLFREEYSGGEYYGINIQATWLITAGLFAQAMLDYQAVPEIKGNTEILDLADSEKEFYRDSVGLDNKATMFSLVLGYAL